MVTLKQIAKLAGVSVRSVSVVLNGKAEESRIRPAVAENIERIAKELNYRPNALARAIRIKKTSQIGVLVRELSNPHTGATIEAIERNLSQHGYKLLLGLTNGSTASAKAYLSEFSHGIVDGILNLDPAVDSHSFEEAQVNVPFLHFLRASPGFTLQLEYKKGIRLALDHLWNLGHRTIGFASGPANDISTKERLQGFRAFFREHDGFESKSHIAYGDWSFLSGKQCAISLQKEGCTAILGANDLMAIGAMRALQEMGLDVPEEISVIGFDDSSNAEMADPPLTSVRIPVEDIVKLTVDALVGLMNNTPTPLSVRIDQTLTIRRSTAPPALALVSK